MQLQSDDECHFNERDYEDRPGGGGAGVKKVMKLFAYFNCNAYVTSLKTSLPSAPSSPAGWRSGCSELCVTFMMRSSCPFVCLFLSARFSPHLQRSLAREEVFSGPGWLVPLIDLFQVPAWALWHCLQRETHVCEHTHTHTCTLTHTL